ncbi:MAG: NmrA family NAD(P)-binding protein [Spirochaetota bacterium]
MARILVTGATGNVGTAVIESLLMKSKQVAVSAGVRKAEMLPADFAGKDVKVVAFDFLDQTTFPTAMDNADILFLLRPPAISDVQSVFGPLIDSAVEDNIRHIIFLSVQGAEKNTMIPHNKIERLIVKSGIPYTFLRPAYFMQNFLTSLSHDLKVHSRIFLPAGQARFTLVDVRDIGSVTAEVVAELRLYTNQALVLTSNDLLTFGEMADKLTLGLGRQISYMSPSPFRFYRVKRAEGLPRMLVMVMIMLHFLPRFQTQPKVTDTVQKILKRKPIDFNQFISDYQDRL